MDNQIIFVRSAIPDDVGYANEIITETEISAIARGSGISKRTVATVTEKMNSGRAVIAVTAAGEWVGFAYFDSWENGKYVSNSGLIVAPKFRGSGVAKSIKQRIFRMSRRLFPHAKIFSITSGSAIMRLNMQLGFMPVGFEQLTTDENFWNGCKSCVNYDVLQGKHRCNCLCTAMLFDPLQQVESQNTLNLLPQHQIFHHEN